MIMHHFKHTTSSDPGTQMVCTKDAVFGPELAEDGGIHVILLSCSSPPAIHSNGLDRMAAGLIPSSLHWFRWEGDSPNHQELLQTRRRQSQNRLHRSAGGHQSNFGDEDWAVSDGVPVEVCAAEEEAVQARELPRTRQSSGGLGCLRRHSCGGLWRFS